MIAVHPDDSIGSKLKKIVEQEIMQKQFHPRCFLQLYNVLDTRAPVLCSFPTKVHPVEEQVS